MLYELIAAVTAGFAAGGIALILRRLSGGKLTKGAIPIAAGLAMIGFAVWNEYSWADRTIDGLPDGFRTVATHESTQPLRPWTYLAPLTEGVIAADTRTIRRHRQASHLALVDLYVFRRWHAPVRRAQIVDCRERRRADVETNTDLDADAGRDWVDMETDDPIFPFVCAG